MKVNTAFQACMYFTILLLIFTLAVNFVSSAKFFDTTVETGVNLSDENESAIFFSLTGENAGNLWLVVFGVGIGGAAILAALTHNASIIGIYLFSTIFWGSYGIMLGVTKIGNYIPLEFMIIATAALVFIFMGAIIGMLSGSG